MKPLLAAFAALFVLPAFAADWPTPESPKVEVRLDDVVVRAPAPDWMNATSLEPVTGTGREARGEWLSGKGLDMVGEMFVVRIETWDDKSRILSTAYQGGVMDDCDSSTLRHTVPERGKRMTGGVLVCDSAGGQSVIFISRSQQTNDHRFVIEYWYRLEFEPFDRLDAQAWPISEAGVIAMAQRISDMTEVTIGGQPEIIEPR